MTFEWRIVAANPRLRVRPATFTVTNTGEVIEAPTTEAEPEATDEENRPTTAYTTQSSLDNATLSTAGLANTTGGYDYYDYAVDYPDDFMQPTVYTFDWVRYTLVDRRDGSLIVDYDGFNTMPLDETYTFILTGLSGRVVITITVKAWLS